MTVARALSAALAAVLVASATTAAAQDAMPPPDTAPRLYRRGAAAYGEGHFEQAAELFARAYAMSPEPSLLYNLGLAREGANQPDLAIEAYEHFLAAAPNAPEAPEVERILAGLRRERDLRVELDQRHDATTVPAAAHTTHSTAPAATRDATTLIAGVTIGGAGLLTLAAAIVTGVVAQSTYDSARAEPVQLSAYQLEGRADDLGLAATVSYVVGGILTLAGVVTSLVGVLVLDAPHDVHVALGPTGVAVTGVF